MANISNFNQLLAMQATGNYELTQDIDCQGQIGIKCLVADFKGSLDGKGHTISNLRIEENINRDAQPVALFHTVRKSSIKNITFDNLTIVTTAECYKPNVAALCVECSNSQIENVIANVISPSNSMIPLIYDSNDNDYNKLSVTCNGKKSINIKFN